MAAIPGPIVLIVGVIVAGFSYYLNGRETSFNGPYILFIYIGGAMIFYGFVKTLIWFIMRKSNKEIRDDAREFSKIELEGRQAQLRQSSSRSDTRPSHNTRSCQVCGLRHYAHANFCQHCGTRLR